MSVIGLHGIPGCGKTLSASAICLKQFKKDNSLLKRFIRYIKKEPIYVNKVYTNYPILLDKKHKIYSNVITIYDLDNRYSFLYDSIIVIDEVQAFFDSHKDFRSFPEEIATFFQFHRHFGIKDIYLLSQHPRRIVTYLRDVISQYHRIKTFFKLPIIHIGLVCYKLCYEFEDYSASFTRDKEIKKLLQIKTKFYLFNYKKVFKSFDSRYLKVFNEDKILCPLGTYDSLKITDQMYELLNAKLFKRK